MAQEAPVQAEKLIAILNQGAGPMHTAHGVLLGNSANTLSVPESLAKKLCDAYKFVKRVSEIIPGATPVDAAVNARLQGEVVAIGAQLKAAQDQVTDLTARLQEFLAADSKKALEALQAKHGDAVAPAEAAPVAAGAAA